MAESSRLFGLRSVKVEVQIITCFDLLFSYFYMALKQNVANSRMLLSRFNLFSQCS